MAELTFCVSSEESRIRSHIRCAETTARAPCRADCCCIDRAGIRRRKNIQSAGMAGQEPGQQFHIQPIDIAQQLVEVVGSPSGPGRDTHGRVDDGGRSTKLFCVLPNQKRGQVDGQRGTAHATFNAKQSDDVPEFLALSGASAIKRDCRRPTISVNCDRMNGHGRNSLHPARIACRISSSWLRFETAMIAIFPGNIWCRISADCAASSGLRSKSINAIWAAESLTRWENCGRL